MTHADFLWLPNTKMTEQLDEQQQAAVRHGKGAACIIAGAGTGKTTTLVNRIVYLIQKEHIPANQILVTTFTRKATAELYARCFEKLGNDAHQLKVSTIDSAILDFSQQAVRLGLISPFRLLDDPAQKVLLFYSALIASAKIDFSRSWLYHANKSGIFGLLEMSVKERPIMNMDEKEIIQQRIRNKIDSFSPYSRKHGFYTYQKIESMVENTTDIYYNEIMELGLKSYDMIENEFLSCLKNNKSFAKNIYSKFSTILVDEFQDTSRVQAEILLLLSGKKKNIWAVGDPCQQIYEWRGAGTDNFKTFVETTKAEEYRLLNNRRSTQKILDGAYNFLNEKVPQLKREKFLSKLKSVSSKENLPIYSGDLDQALFFVKQLLDSKSNLKPSDIAILSRELSMQTRKEIRNKVKNIGLETLFHSSRADRAMEETIGSPSDWKAGKALTGLYSHSKIKKQITQTLVNQDFSKLRIIRPLADAAEALDSTLPANILSFKEAWSVLQKTQDREISVSPAIAESNNKVQVMTIHAAKGLEFPVVILMTLGKKFPKPKHRQDKEVFRLIYVGVTRAKDLCILVHTKHKPITILKSFGTGTVNPISKKQKNITTNFQLNEKKTLPPLIAATHLELYEQCPLHFAAYHEGRYLPTWSEKQSMGSRIHKALEYYLQKSFLEGKFPTKKDIINNCFNEGYKDGDSPIRKISSTNTKIIKEVFEAVTMYISKRYKRVIAIEHKYRYVNSNGQAEGVIDAILERRDGKFVLKEWKNTKSLSEKNKAHEYQIRAGALGIHSQKLYQIDEIEIVPLLSDNISKDTIKFSFNDSFINESKEILENVFINLANRQYSFKKGKHCTSCQLKPFCPAY